MHIVAFGVSRRRNLIRCFMPIDAVLLRWLIWLLILICTAATLILPSAVEVLIFVSNLTARWISNVLVRWRPYFPNFCMRALLVKLISFRLLAVLWSNFDVTLYHFMKIYVTYPVRFWFLLIARLLVMMVKLKTLMFLTRISSRGEVSYWVRFIWWPVTRENLFLILCHTPQILHEVKDLVRRNFSSLLLKIIVTLWNFCSRIVFRTILNFDLGAIIAT